MTLVKFMTALQILNLFHVFTELSFLIREILLLILFFLIEWSLTTMVWLNTFYCTQTVLPHSDFSIRLKKNIKFIVYNVMVFDKQFFLIDLAMCCVPAFSLMSSINSTLTTTLWHSLELPPHSKIRSGWLQ